MLKYEEYFPSIRNSIWFKYYLIFIQQRRKRKPLVKVKYDGYEYHHIVPRCYLPKKFWKDKDNIILLTVREHFIAHLILWRTFRDSSCTQAFEYMTSRKGYKERLNSRQFSQLKAENKQFKKKRKRENFHHTEESKKKMSESHIGLSPSSETREKIRRSSLGRKLSEEAKLKISQRNITEETRRKLSESAKKQKPTMLGKHHSEETKLKISQAHLGKRYTEESKAKMSKAKKGRHWCHDPLTKENRMLFNLPKGWEWGYIPKNSV